MVRTFLFANELLNLLVYFSLKMYYFRHRLNQFYKYYYIFKYFSFNFYILYKSKNICIFVKKIININTQITSWFLLKDY